MPGERPPNHAEDQDPNVMRVYLVRAQNTANSVTLHESTFFRTSPPKKTGQALKRAKTSQHY